MTKEKEKSPRVVRGTATIHHDDRIEFKPYAEGEPTQLNVRSVKGGKLFTTTSAKKPLQVAHLTCPMDAADPWHEYTSQLRKLGIKPQEPQQQPESLRIVSEDSLQVWLDEEMAELTVTSTLDLNCHFRNWQAELLRQVQLIVRRMPSNDNFNKLINNLKKGGTKNV